MTDIGEILRYDALDTAERLTGKSYKEDEDTMGLGFLMHISHGERKAAALKATDDTHWGISFDDALPRTSM